MKQSVTIQQISERYQISKNHLMKVVQELSATGYVDAIRGKNGGLRLSRLPANINIGALVRQAEKDAALVECFGITTNVLLPLHALLSICLPRHWKPFLRV